MHHYAQVSHVVHATGEDHRVALWNLLPPGCSQLMLGAPGALGIPGAQGGGTTISLPAYKPFVAGYLLGSSVLDCAPEHNY